MLQPQIITVLQDVKTELSLLNIPKEYPTEAVKRGYAARSNATENDPPSTAGNNAFSAIVRAIRELFLPEGWERLNKHNLCFTINIETKTAIVVSSGDSNVGMKDCNIGYPRTKNPKGERYKEIISDNRDMFGFEQKIQSILFPDFQTFVLLYYYDRKKGEMRLELSSPIEMDINGFVNGWHKRIIFSPILFNVQLNPERQTELSSVDLQDFDIPVKRRKQ